MNEVRFQTTVGDDRMIHLPEGIDLPPGQIEVTVRSGPAATAAEPVPDAMASTRAWMLELAGEAERALSSLDLPADLAEHHDHYAHGKPRS
ncbi:MAG: hypothetical protein ACP5XB_18580 [Isosphaeraceae bacterium]